MKYLKLFEGQKEREELGELIPELDELFQDLKDHGFKIEIKQEPTHSFDFSENDIAISYKYINNEYINNDQLDCLYVKIDKYRNSYIDDIFINNLLFIESYSKEELNLKVNYYFYSDKAWHGCYYKNIKDLPKDEIIHKICICFIKA